MTAPDRYRKPDDPHSFFGFRTLRQRVGPYRSIDGRRRQQIHVIVIAQKARVMPGESLGTSNYVFVTSLYDDCDSIHCSVAIAFRKELSIFWLLNIAS